MAVSNGRIQAMHYIGAHEARTQFGELLDRVARGEKIVVTRHGEEIAVLVPPEKSGSGPEEAFRYFRQLREKLKSEGKFVTPEEIRSAIEEGRP